MTSTCEATNTIVRVQQAKLVGLVTLPVDAQHTIAAKLQEQDYDNCSIEEISARVRDELQQRGFYEASVHDPELTELESGDGYVDVSVLVRVDEGARYRLGILQLAGYKAFPPELLRAQFPITPGDIFDTGKVHQALENLKKLYGSRGYIEFTALPQADVDRERHVIWLFVQLGEGPQYRVGEVSFVGLDPETTQTLSDEWNMPTGSIYNGAQIEQFFLSHHDLLPQGATPDRNVQTHLNNEAQRVDITLDFRQAP